MTNIRYPYQQIETTLAPEKTLVANIQSLAVITSKSDLRMNRYLIQNILTDIDLQIDHTCYQYKVHSDFLDILEKTVAFFKKTKQHTTPAPQISLDWILTAKRAVFHRLHHNNRVRSILYQLYLYSRYYHSISSTSLQYLNIPSLDESELQGTKTH